MGAGVPDPDDRTWLTTNSATQAEDHGWSQLLEAENVGAALSSKG
jgi:hypothetical protein